jgi:hypothetical protein
MIGQYQSRPALLFAVAFAAILAFNGSTGFELVAQKREQQQGAFQTFERFAKSYRALLPVKARWEKIFPKQSDVKDVYSVYKLIDPESVGLFSPPDAMSISRVQTVLSDGKEIGLTAVCPKTGSREAFVVTAPTIGAMLEGIQRFSERVDIQLTKINLISNVAGKVTAELGLCLLLREAA